jgi:hypothetical protein
MMPTAVKTGLAGVLDRVATVLRLVRPVDLPPPPYERCAGCRRSGRDDQHVPDPDQFNKPKAKVKQVGDPATVPADVDDDTPSWAAFNTDPGAAAERLSQTRARQEKEGSDVRLIDAAPVWCGTCRAWYHAIGCYSTHKTGRHGVHDCNTHD